MENTSPLFALEIKNVSKNYGQIRAVENVSFAVQKGEIFGLIGPDGAGKTTLMRIMVSLINQDFGDAFFLGKAISENTAFVRKNVGYMPQRFSLYQDLTVQENLNFYAKIFQVPKKESLKRQIYLYEFSKLLPFRSRRAGQLSGGMKQKLALSCMLIHEPDIMILDEPTTGVDPIARNEFWEMLHELSKHGKTLIISTPYMEEAAQCHRVGLMYNGNLLAVNSPLQLEKNYSDTLFVIKTDDSYQTFKKMQDTELGPYCNLFSDGIHFRNAQNFTKEVIAQKLFSLKINFHSLEIHKAKLEDIFLNLIKTG